MTDKTDALAQAVGQIVSAYLVATSMTRVDEDDLIRLIVKVRSALAGEAPLPEPVPDPEPVEAEVPNSSLYGHGIEQLKSELAQAAIEQINARARFEAESLGADAPGGPGSAFGGGAPAMSDYGIRASGATVIFDKYIVCLEDNKRCKYLKPHLKKLGLTPEEYRAKWGLADDYPMVAPGVSKARSEISKRPRKPRKTKLNGQSPAAEAAGAGL
jgi:predicted transcriptional regulator